jgi:hypothetical protein
MGTERINQPATGDVASAVVRRVPGDAGRDDGLAGLQRRAGNRTALALLAVGQAKLDVGPADDRYEQEADALAQRVVGSLQRDADEELEDEDEETVSRMADTVSRKAVVGLEGGTLDADTESAISAARSGGSPLQQPVQRDMESAFGADFSGVRVHQGPAAADLNERVGAKAFTVGNDIFFRDGAPDASSTGGQELLAHELTHTIQQGGSKPF